MRRFGFIVAPGFQVMGFGALSVFEFANLSAGGLCYDVHLLSDAVSAVRSSLSVSGHTDAFDDRHFDTILVGRSTGLAATIPALIAFVQHAMLRSRRVAAVCTGTFVLAAASRQRAKSWSRDGTRSTSSQTRPASPIASGCGARSCAPTASPRKPCAAMRASRGWPLPQESGESLRA